MEWVSKIQLGLNLRPEEKKQYEDLLCKYIHLFTFSYKDFLKSPWKNTKLNHYQLSNRSKPSKEGGIQNTLEWRRKNLINYWK